MTVLTSPMPGRRNEGELLSYRTTRGSVQKKDFGMWVDWAGVAHSLASWLALISGLKLLNFCILFMKDFAQSFGHRGCCQVTGLRRWTVCS